MTNENIVLRFDKGAYGDENRISTTGYTYKYSSLYILKYSCCAYKK